MAFKLKKNTQDEIIYDVPYYPQKEANSCWYYGMKMIRHAFDSSLKMPEYHDHVDRYKQLSSFDSDRVFIKNGFVKTYQFIPKGLIYFSKYRLDPQLYAIFNILRKAGPLLVDSGHVFVIVGCNIKENVLYAHYTLPITDDIDEKSKHKPSERFWKFEYTGSEKGWRENEMNQRFLKKTPGLTYSSFSQASRSFRPEEYKEYIGEEYNNNPLGYLKHCQDLEKMKLDYYKFFSKELREKATYMKIDISFLGELCCNLTTPLWSFRC